MSEAPPVYIHVVLTVVYLYGGLSKLRCPRLLRGTLLELGAGRTTATRLSQAMPIVEISGAVALIVTDGWWRRTTIMLLALVLVGGVAASWRGRGRSIPCACLGPGDTAELGGRTWVRNGLLLAISGAAFASEGPSVAQVVISVPTEAVHIGLVAGASALALHLHLGLRRQGVTLRAVPTALSAMQQAPIRQVSTTERLPREVANLSLHRVDGRATDLRTLTNQRTQLLIIIAPDCGACATALSQIGDMQTQIGELADVRALSLQPLCSSPDPDGMPPGSLFVADPVVGRMWSAALLAPGTPVSCVVRQGLVMTHDALSDYGDPDTFIEDLRHG